MTRPFLDERLDHLENALVAVALAKKWQRKYAKFSRKGTRRGSQSLFVHSLNVFSVAKSIGRVLFDLDDEESYIACLGAFLHDYQKTTPKWQHAAISFVEGGETSSEDFAHDDGSKEMLQELSELLGDVERKIADRGQGEQLRGLATRLLNITVYTHDSENQTVATRRRRQVGPIDSLSRVVRLCDSIASSKSARDVPRRNKDPDLPPEKTVSFAYHELSSLRGLVSSFLDQALICLMKEHGYTPLLHFGDGTAYVLIGEQSWVDDPRGRLAGLLDQEIEKFQESDIYEIGLTNAVVGPLTQTTWPCIQLVREKDIPQLIRHLSSRGFANMEDKNGEKYYKNKSSKPEYKRALDQFVRKTGSERNDILAKMLSDFNLMVYFADFLKGYRVYAEESGVRDEYAGSVHDWLRSHVGDFDLDKIKGISNTSKTDLRTQVIAELWKLDSDRLHESKDRRKTIEDAFISVMKRVVRQYKRYAPSLLTDEARESLIADVKHCPITLMSGKEIREMSDNVADRYSEGKDRTKRVCNICGNTSEEDAPATLFGEGSQKFTNFLPGGIRIGKSKKAQVCALCMAEATIRAFFFRDSPEAVYVVIPDLSLSLVAHRQWAEGVDEFLRTEKLGLSVSKPWNMSNVYRALSRGEVIDTSKGLVNLLRPLNTSVVILTRYLEKERETPAEIRYEIIDSELEDVSFESIARAHLANKIRIDDRHLGGYKRPARTQHTSYVTPSHFFVFSRYRPSLNEDESESTVGLREHLLALVLADVFHANVIVARGYHPITDLSMDGVIQVDTPAPATKGLKNMGLDRVVRLHQVEQALQRLSALTLVSMSYVERLGKNGLLRLTSMNRGAILRRAQMEAGKKLTGRRKRDLVGLLEQLPAVAEEHIS